MHFAVITLIIATLLSNVSNARIEAMIVERFLRAMTDVNARLGIGDVTVRRKL
jgi:hypothetical protein